MTPWRGMKSHLNPIPALLCLALFVLGGLFLGCGSSEPEPFPFSDCQTDAECETGEKCFNQYCIPGDSPTEDITVGTDTVDTPDTVDVQNEDISQDVQEDTGSPDLIEDSEEEDTFVPDIAEDIEQPNDTEISDAGDTTEEPDTALPPGTCLEHEDCPSLQLCAPGSGICVEPPICLWNEDCDDDRVCDAGKCLNDYENCTTNEDCTGNGVCNAVTHTCQSLTPCESDDDCVDDLFCSGGNCIECVNNGHCPSFKMSCVSNFCQEADICSSDEDCLNGNICSETECGAPDYPLDIFEDNDFPDDAKVLTEGGAESNLTIQQWDDDWYKVNVSAGEGVIVRVAFDNDNGDLDAILYNDTASLILDLDTSATHVAIVSQPPSGSFQTYLVHVTNTNGNVPSYSIEAFKPPKAFCHNDDLDMTIANNNASTATLLSESTYDAVGRRICPQDEDWYALNVGGIGATSITAAIEYVHHLGDLDIRIYDEDLTPMSNTSAPNSFEYAIAEDLPSGTYYIVVSGAEEDVANSYALEIQSVSSASCDFDAYELNDKAIAAPVFEGISTQMILCPNDVDWFTTEIPPGKGMRSHISYSNVSSQLRVEHLLSDGVTVSHFDEGAYFPKGPTNQEASFEGTNKTITLYTRVSRIDPPNFDSMTPYTLEVEIVDSFCDDDENEPNNNAETASSAKTLFGLSNDGKACPGDSDWYSFDVEAGDIISFDLLHDTENNPLLATVFESNGTTAMGINFLDFNEFGSYAVLNTNTIPGFTDGTYFISVTGASPTPYSLTVHIAKGSSECLFDDVAEPNNTLFNSKPLSLSDPSSYYFCPNNPDIFHFVAGPQSPPSLSVTVPPENQKVTVTYTSPSTETVQAWILDEAGGTIDLPTAEEGIHFISLHSPYDTTYEIVLNNGP